MKKALFAPIWDDFELPPVTEGTGVSAQTPLRIRATITLAPFETQIEIADKDLAELSSVTKDGVSVSYTINGNVLTVPSSSRPTLLELERDGTPTFSIFVGEIVPGLQIDATGRLKGIVGNIPSFTPRSYRFGIRALHEGIAADTIKTWVANPTHGTISWNTTTLPAFTLASNLITGRAFYTMGEFKRGQTVEIGIDLNNPDFTPLEVQYRAVIERVEGATSFSGLPMGLSISNNPFVIKGFIPAEAIPGDYFIELFVDEPQAPTPIILHFPLRGDAFDKFTAINRLNWITEDDLGEMLEGHPSAFSVEARNDDGSAVTYTLAPGSRQLPMGLTLASNGEIRGKATHVPHDTTYVITVKASSGLFVNTRTFKFKVKNVFQNDKHLTVWMPLSGPERVIWNDYLTQIPADDLYRHNDPAYAAPSRMLLIRGLNARPITSLIYDQPFEVILGPFKLAKVIDNGRVLYEVIYREFFDPKSKAGGFVPDKEDVIPSPVFYPQNPSVRITEGTIRNLRSNLVDHLGLNSTPLKAKKLGRRGGELLDRWMTDYVSAGIVAYVQPGAGEGLLKTLSYEGLPVGYVVDFDRMLIESDAGSYFYHLGWDNNDPDDIVVGAPLPPLDFRVDGVPFADVSAQSAEPVLTWAPREPDLVYSIQLFNGNTLLRTEEIEGNIFKYTAILQAVDADPGHIRFVITAKRGSLVSDELSVPIVIRSGWGYGWGYRYGGRA